VSLEVHCINSGQGNSVAVRLPDDSFMVVDIDCHDDTLVDPVGYLKELVPEEYDADEGRYIRRLACAAFTHPHQAFNLLHPCSTMGEIQVDIYRQYR
jgi:hypothetical protein